MTHFNHTHGADALYSPGTAVRSTYGMRAASGGSSSKMRSPCRAYGSAPKRAISTRSYRAPTALRAAPAAPGRRETTAGRESTRTVARGLARLRRQPARLQTWRLLAAAQRRAARARESAEGMASRYDAAVRRAVRQYRALAS